MTPDELEVEIMARDADTRWRELVREYEQLRTTWLCSDEWQPPHLEGSHVGDCGTCAGLR